MKVEITGKKSRISVNKDSGEVRTYNELFFVEAKEMMARSKNETVEGRRAGSRETTLDLSDIKIGDIYFLELEERKFRDSSWLELIGYEHV